MLSYRHAFHAGNFADVLKHSVLHYVLRYMTEKDKGFSYIDSHSGAGMYQLKEEYAQKTGEYKDGIEKLMTATELSPMLADYVDFISAMQPGNSLTVYPGSPAVANNSMRKQDSAQLFELHKSDFALLEDFCQKWRQANVHNKDGYKGLLKQLPPLTRRGVVLIDPPYEIKTDYQQAVDTIVKGAKTFATGTYILWYPVVTRSFINDMATTFINSGLKNTMQVEFCLKPDSEAYGMTGTGLFIVNPPWKLKSLLEQALPELQRYLGSDKSSTKLLQLVPE